MSANPPLVSLSRLRIVQKNFLTRRGGRHVARSAIAVEYRPAQQRKVNEGSYERVLNAEVLHGDEQTFWGERRGFYRKPVQYFPTWDRFAQTLVLMTRHVPRVPQEMAFRLLAVFLKLLLLPRLVMNAELMLPSWVVTNAENVVQLAQATNEEEKRDPRQQPQKAGESGAVGKKDREQ